MGDASRTESSFAVLRGHFQIEKADKVTLCALGLGFFRCYINGECINPDTFLPLASDYEASADPKDEVLSGHRIYVPQFDITPFVRDGDNVIAIHYGGGWYTHSLRAFGLPKAIYRITVTSPSGTKDFISDETCRIDSSFVTDYQFTQLEQQDHTAAGIPLWADLDDCRLPHAVPTEQLDTDYCTTDCPCDALIEELSVTAVCTKEGKTVYDCGKNTSGYPVLRIHAKRGEAVELHFSEALSADGEIDSTHAHGQCFRVISDGETRTVQPVFTWYGFRYFEVIGSAEVVSVKVVHAAVGINSSFWCDNEVLNWTYHAFLNSMRTNMHTGIPSDCPHIERRGYTGDGQLTCHAALSTLDAKAFYEKWLQDIADSQDKISGRVQYTAPYIRSGGGPGGWGSAIVEVPLQLYRHYGDKQPLEKYYGHMRRYVDFLETHSEFGLVTSNKDGEWCLGEWCGPRIIHTPKEIVLHKQQVILPPPMVNTYFAIKVLEQLCEIARLIGKEEDVSDYESKAMQHKKALKAAYFSTYDHNLFLNVQGANAFAVDLGLGDDLTYQKMVDYYKRLGYFDTGIFATDILTRVLFEHGDGELAARLLASEDGLGFGNWKKNGATTLLEYWNVGCCRSFNHHMFGAVVAYFFEHLLGIRQKPHTVGYRFVQIAPQAVSCFGEMSGSLTSPQGRISVSYKREDALIRFDISIPPKTHASFLFADKEYPLVEGDNRLTVSLA